MTFIGLALVLGGVIAFCWPNVLTVKEPMKWRYWGGGVAAFGVLALAVA